MRTFSESDVERLLSMKEAIAAVEASERALGAERAINLPRRRIQIPSGAALHAMDAAVQLDGRWYCGFKTYATSRSGAHFVVGLFDGRTAELLALFEANRLGQRRTGAASGVATRLLAPENARSVGLIGAGWQAESQLEAVCHVRNIRNARVYSRKPESRSSFARRMSERLDIKVTAADSARRAVEGAEIVITATTSREPVLPEGALASQVHINAIGANSLQRRELSAETVQACDRLVVDSREQAAIEAGDLDAALGPPGSDGWRRVEELAQVLLQGRGRGVRDRRTLFKSTGLAVWDVACAVAIYRKAKS